MSGMQETKSSTPAQGRRVNQVRLSQTVIQSGDAFERRPIAFSRKKAHKVEFGGVTFFNRYVLFVTFCG